MGFWHKTTFLKEQGLLSGKQFERSLKHYPRTIPCCSTPEPPQKPSYFLCFYWKCLESPLLTVNPHPSPSKP